MGKLTISSKRLASIAAVGIKTPSKLSSAEVRILAASVLAQAKIKPVEVSVVK